MRFLHLADTHLDTPFVGRTPDLAKRLRKASRDAFRRALALARERELDAVLVAGDLFDVDRLSFQSERFLSDELAALGEAGIPLLYATGNHDPGEGLGGRGRIEWPEHVVRFADAEPRTVDVLRAGRPVGRVTAAGHATSREARDLSGSFPRPDPSLPAVALLHTQVGGARGEGEHHRYAPSELARLRASSFDYWALGHVHLRQELSAVPAIHYPGNPQGRSFRETGAKGALVVEIPGPGTVPAVEFVELGSIRWERIEVSDLAEAATLDGLIEAVRARWEEARGEDPGLPGAGWILRVELAGPSPLHRDLSSSENRETVVRELATALGALDVELRTDELRPRADPEPYLERQDAAGETLRLARDLAAGRSGGTGVAAALGLDPGGLAGAEGGDPDEVEAYLRELLRDGDRTLLDRFLALGGEGP